MAVGRWVVLAACLGSAGCIGSFHLTHTVFSFNQHLNDSVLVRQLVFVGFLVVPVYELAVVADALILNPIEAAVGTHPLAPRTAETRIPIQRQVLAVDQEDGTYAVLEGGPARRVVRRGEGFVLFQEGVIVASVEPESDGSLTVTGLDGRVRFLDAERVAGVLERVRRSPDSLAAEVSGALAVVSGSTP